MKPTVIGSKKATHTGPTVIKTSVPPTSNHPKPTAIPTSLPPALTSIPAVSKPIVSGAPTAMPGVIRKRIPVTLESLMMQNPATKREVAERALHLIHTINVEATTDRIAVMWGHDIQLSYGKLVSECLTLSQDSALQQVSGHVSRIFSILELIDVKKVCGIEGNGMFSGILKKSTKKIDSLPELAKAQAELEQIMTLLGTRIDALLTLKDKIELVSVTIDKTGDDIEASAMAAAFIADHISKETPSSSLAQRFSERSMSLTETLAQIRQSSSMRTMQIERPLQLITTVQQVALVSVPGLIGNIASIKGILEGNTKPTVTDADELGDHIDKIKGKLKGT